MDQGEYHRHYVGEDYTAVKLPYAGDDFDLLVVMPAEGTFESFEQSLNGDRMQEIANNLSDGLVILEMPRFKLEYSFSAKEELQALGLATAFDRNRANFHPIADRLFGIPIEAIWIEDVAQKALVEVNEAGSEAVAATVPIFGSVPTGMPPPPPEITIDRPFLFLIRHSDTGAVMFMGRVLNPQPGATAIARSEISSASTLTPVGSSLPQVFIGVAYLNGAPAPENTAIIAYDGDKEIGRTSTREDGNFNLKVAKSEGPITFKVGGVDTPQVIPEWRLGDITDDFNLTAGYDSQGAQ